MSIQIRRQDQTFVHKGWGWERWITNDPDADYCLKELFIAEGMAGSLHLHLKKDETLHILSGKLHVSYEQKIWKPGDDIVPHYRLSNEHFFSGGSMRLRPGVAHRLEAAKDTLILEASTYHDEDDVVRFSPGDLLPGQEFKENWQDATGYDKKDC